MRVVLDTNVVASAFFWNGAPAELLHACRAEHVDLFSSEAMLSELTNVVSRRKFAKHIFASGVPIDRLIGIYREGLEIVNPIEVHGVAPDQDDDVVLGTALGARADFIVSGDRGFLSVQQFRGVRIMSVREALGTLGKGTRLKGLV